MIGTDAFTQTTRKEQTDLVGLHNVGDLLAILLKILVVETVKKSFQELQELDNQGAIIEESKVGEDDALDHRVRNDGVQPPREHVDASKQEPEACPFLLSFLIFVQVINRHKERWDEHEIRVKTVVSEESVQNTEHYHRESHCNVVERHVDLFLQLLELLYALQPK